MQKFLALAFLVSLASIYAQEGEKATAAVTPEGEKGTAGVTPGEPGEGDHGMGMKGLGGGSIEVLCSPKTVARGENFTVNVHYKMDIKRPIDIHVDVLNAKTKTFYAGDTIPMEFQEGTVFANIRMPENAAEPFLWKVFSTPRDEPFPNMLAETGFEAHLGEKTEGNCRPVEVKGSDPDPNRNVDFVLLKEVPKVITPGSTVPVKISYNMASEKEGNMVASVMYKATNTLVNSAAVAAKPGRNTVEIEIPVPADVKQEDIYVIATLTPPGKTWEERLGEDRTYNTKLAPAPERRMLRK